MTLVWLAADLRTGAVLDDLPSLVPEWPLRRTICTYDTAVLHLHLKGAPADWMRATKPGATNLVCYDDDDPNGAILWAGWVVKRTRTVGSSIIDLAVTTLEGYADRRYVPDKQYSIGAYDVIADIWTRYVADGTEPGVAHLNIVQPDGDGPPVDYTAGSGQQWQNTDNATVLDRTGQVIGEYGGEFTVEWGWRPGGTALQPTLTIADMLGNRVVGGGKANVAFDLPGDVTDGTLDDDYSSGVGANKVVYYSTGSGSVTPYAPAVYADDFDDRPTFEYRDQPAANATVAQLGRYAGKAVRILAPGRQSVSLTASRASAAAKHQRIGTDWGLGDDIGYALGGVNSDGSEAVDILPGGLDGLGRAVAYEFSDKEQTPILADKEVYKEAGT